MFHTSLAVPTLAYFFQGRTSKYHPGFCRLLLQPTAVQFLHVVLKASLPCAGGLQAVEEGHGTLQLHDKHAVRQRRGKREAAGPELASGLKQTSLSAKGSD